MVQLPQCSICPLNKNDQSMVVGETNVPDDLTKVRIVFLAEAPAHEEREQNRPLVGPAGRIFRHGFEMYSLFQLPYYISNVVLCTNIDGRRTNNPPQKAIEACRPQWLEILRITDPEVICIMGSVPMAAFGIADSGILSKIGKYEWKHPWTGKTYELYLNVHPSYVQRNGGINTEYGRLFLKQFEELALRFELLSVESTNDTNDNVDSDDILDIVPGAENGSSSAGLKDVYCFDLPSWMLKEDVCLFDVQIVQPQKKVVYIMKTSDGKKRYHKTNLDRYYYYRIKKDISSTPKIIDVQNNDKYNVEVIRCTEQPFIVNPGETHYESDVKIDVRRAIDYYYLKKKKGVEEPHIDLNILFFDIEVMSIGTRAFPDPKKAERPINAISFQLNDQQTHVYVLRTEYMDTKYDENKKRDDCVVQFFDSEKELIEAFCRFITQNDVIDIMAGWNVVGFDIPYIYNRMKHLRINPNILSPLRCTVINPMKYGDILIAGLYVLDLLEQYKMFTASTEESYKLEAIANKILGSGKVTYEGTLGDLYMNDLDKFIAYSARDTAILYELSEKLGHVDLRNEMRRIAGTTWSATETTMGLVDGLVLSFAKERGLICKRAIEGQAKTKFEGAYVRTPIAGLHDWVVDLDFTSLYPSIIISLNCGPDTYAAKVDEEIAYLYIYKRDKLPDSFEIVFDPLRMKKKMIISKEKFLSFMQKIEGIMAISGCVFLGHRIHKSFISDILAHLLESRVEYKNRMKEAKNRKDEQNFRLFHNMQLSYKILANSIYGVLGNHAFRFFEIDLARTVTLTGQEVIKFAGYHVCHYMKDGSKEINPDFMENYDEKDIPYLMYTDTDSIFLHIGKYLKDKGEEV